MSDGDYPFNWTSKTVRKMIEHNEQIVSLHNVRYVSIEDGCDYGDWSARHNGKIHFVYDEGSNVTLRIGENSDVKDIYDFIWKELTK